MKKIILFASFFVASFGAFGQSDASQTIYSSTQLNSDLDYLVKSIIETHPNPFTVVSKSDFLKQVGEIKMQLANGADYRKFYQLVAPLVASVSDGHTAVNFPGRKIMTDDSELFPFVASCDFQKKAITLDDFVGEESPFPLGSQLVSVNGILAEQIIDKIVANTSGESKEYRLKKGSSFYFFGFILKTYFDFEGDFEIVYKAGNTKQKTTVKPVTFKGLQEIMKAKSKSNKKPTEEIADYSLLLKPEIKTAIIDFRYFDDEQKFGIFLKTTFDTISKLGIRNLVIDIRNNGGGNSVLGDKLFAYIAKKPFTQYGATEVKYSQLQKDFYKRKCADDSSFCETSKFLSEQKNSVVEVLKADGLIKPNVTPNRFDGKIYLLTSWRTFSSAANFAQCFKHYKMGTIVGEETGGWIVCYGDKVTTELPNTKMPLSVSTKKFYTVGSSNKDLQGILPDVRMPSGEALDFVLDEISKRK